MNFSSSEESYFKTCYVFKTRDWLVMDFPSNKYKLSRIATILSMGVLLFPTILINLVATLTILKSRQLSNKIGYFLILVQSAVDLGVGCLGIPFSTYHLATPFFAFPNCLLDILAIKLAYVPSAISIFISLAMSFERYISILHPYKSLTILTKRRIKIYLLFSVAVSVTVIALSFYFDRVIVYFFVLIVLLLFIFTGFVYTRIYFVVRKLDRSVARPSPYPANDEYPSKRKLFLREVKRAKSCFLVVVCLFLTLSPSLILPILFKFPGPGLFLSEYLSWTIVIVSANPCVNSIIFFWSIILLRKEAIKCLKACACRY